MQQTAVLFYNGKQTLALSVFRLGWRLKIKKHSKMHHVHKFIKMNYLEYASCAQVY